MANRGGLGSLVGGLLSANLLGPQPATLPSPPLLSSAPTTTLQRVVKSLDSCDVKSQGMCCYFPEFCDPIARCISDPRPANVFELAGSLPKCMCPEGFEGDGRTRGSGCQNVNECDRGLAKCEHTCVDLIPGYQCGCRPGFRLNGDGRTCSDIDECTEGTSGCSQQCTNLVGSYKCDCHEGYDLSEDGKSCVDLDECMEARLSGYSVCQFDDLCVNLKGTYQCGCPPGTKRNSQDPRRCVDIDECTESENPCPNSLVKDVHSGVVKSSQMCENSYGGWQCKCLKGTKPRINFTHLTVINEEDVLFKTSDDIRSVHLSATESAAKVECVDLDECQEDTSRCASKDSNLPAMCVNTWLSYECVCLKDGTEWNEELQTCQDIDECDSAICGNDPNIICQNLSPGYQCSCSDGYDRVEEPSGQYSCRDIDECAQRLAQCPPHSTCMNREGGFDCVCDAGFQPVLSQFIDGRGHRSVMECRDVDECALGFCPSPCLNLPGTYACGCPVGFMSADANTPDAPVMWNELQASIRSEIPLAHLSPQEVAIVKPNFRSVVMSTVGCVDIDECSLTSGLVCGVGCTCVNRLGGFTCECPEDRKVTHTRIADDSTTALIMAKSLGDHLRILPINLILLHHPDPVATLKALLTLLPNETDPWMITHMDWASSHQIDVDQSLFDDFPDLPALPYESLLAIFGDALYHSSIQVCSVANICSQRSYNPCPSNLRPCCQPVGDGTMFECVPRANPFSRLSLRSFMTCPHGSVDRSSG